MKKPNMRAGQPTYLNPYFLMSGADDIYTNKSNVKHLKHLPHSLKINSK